MKTPPHELTLLGAPILKGKAVDEAIQKKVDALERAISRLALLHAHDARCLLRNSISIPKLLFVLCTLDCFTHPALIRYNKVLREGLVSIMNVDFNNDPSTQATLQGKLEDSGFRSAVALAHSVFKASAVGIHTLQNAIIPRAFRDQSDEAVDDTSLQVWLSLSGVRI